MRHEFGLGAEQPKKHWTADFSFSKSLVAGETEASSAGEQLLPRVPTRRLVKTKIVGKQPPG
jgi:hypothetical protein